MSTVLWTNPHIQITNVFQFFNGGGFVTAGYDSYEAFDENGETLRCCEAIV